jgi:hypothetical protein
VAEQESVQKKVAETERRTREAMAQVASRQEEVEMLRAKIVVTTKELKVAKDNEKNAIKIAINHVENKVAQVSPLLLVESIFNCSGFNGLFETFDLVDPAWRSDKALLTATCAASHLSCCESSSERKCSMITGEHTTKAQRETPSVVPLQPMKVPMHY